MAWLARKTEKREKFAHEALAHIDHLYRVAFHLAREQDQAQDLVQETYVRALASHEQFISGTNLKAWLTRILYNLFFDHYRQRKKWASLEEPDDRETTGFEAFAPTNAEPESWLLQKEMKTKVSDALAKVPEHFRAPMLLVDMGEFSYAEAAEILACPVGTVRSRLSRGRKLLYKQLKGYVSIQKTSEGK